VSGWGRTVVLNGVSLTTTPGSMPAVLGRNGAGKTTLLVTLMGLTTLPWRHDPNGRQSD
jgi:branched-chain amino acid transport system ATP-binding protein